MFEAQLLITKTAEYSVYSPWFPRGGDNALFTLEVIEIEDSGHTTLKVEVFTKSTEDVNNGDITAGNKNVTRQTFGRTTGEWLSSADGMEELVRYKFNVSNDRDTAGKWVLFRMLPPSWFDNAS